MDSYKTNRIENLIRKAFQELRQENKKLKYLGDFLFPLKEKIDHLLDLEVSYFSLFNKS